MTTPFPFVSGAVLTAAQMNDITNLPINDQTASYSLVVGDAGKRVVMDVATANTVTVDDSVFTTGDTIFISTKDAPTTITAGAGVTINSASGLVLVAHQSGQLVALSASSFLFVLSAGPAATSGLTMVKAQTAFTTVASATADSVFTSAFADYLVLVSFTTSSSNKLAFKLRVGGVSTSTGYNMQRLLVISTQLFAAQSNAQTNIEFETAGGNFKSFAMLHLVNPQVAEQTVVKASGGVFNGSYANAVTMDVFANQNSSTQFDGIELLTATGTITGTFQIYGYSKTL